MTQMLRNRGFTRISFTLFDIQSAKIRAINPCHPRSEKLQFIILYCFLFLKPALAQ